MKVISAETMRLIDAETIEHFTSSLELMEKAGQACAYEINLFLSKYQCIKKPRILIICGSGNNGGDGFVIARLLQENYEIKICCSSDFKNLSSDAQQMASKVNQPIEFNATNIDYKFDIIVDCLLGTGINRNVSEKYAHLIRQINSANVPVISVDIPSGLNGNNGEIMGCAIKARLTLSIGLPKTGYYLKNGPATVGCLKEFRYRFSTECCR